MSSSESLSFESKISHSNPEINKRLQEVIGKVLKVLEDNPELKKDFTEKFKSIFDMVTNDTEKLNVLLSNIESKMIGELKNLYNEFQNTPNL